MLVSWGELVDKISILTIKVSKLTSPTARANAAHELDHLKATAGRDLDWHAEAAPLHAELLAVNERLWDIENAIRAKEAASCFDGEFIELARSVYRENDLRGRLKRDINHALRSEFVEEKEYTGYGA